MTNPELYTYIVCENFKLSFIDYYGNFQHWRDSFSGYRCRRNCEHCFFSGYPDSLPVQKNEKLSTIAILYTDRKTKNERLECEIKSKKDNTTNIKTVLNNWLISTRITNWGDWGISEQCENGFVIGFAIKVQSYVEKYDNTAMNQLQLLSIIFRVGLVSNKT